MANTYTTNLNLAKPAKGDTDWDDEVNGNMDILDKLGEEHSTDGKHKNITNYGDGNNTDKKRVMHTGEANEPYEIYDASENYFADAADGVNEKRRGEYISRDNIVFVATDGNDSTGDGTVQRPYLTIAKAITEAMANDVILLLPGGYNQAAATLTLSKAISIIALGDRGKTTITGTPATNGAVITISAPFVAGVPVVGGVGRGGDAGLDRHGWHDHL